MQVMVLVAAVAFDCIAPNALVILDRSGSMDDPLAGGERKWDVAVEAVANLVTSFDDRVRFGLGTFPEGSVECTTGQLRLPIGDGQGAQVADYVRGDGPDGKGTPIAASLQAIAAAEPALGDATRDNFVVLVTDGQETCDGQPATTVGSLQARSPQVRTFVVGFGDGVDEGQLNEMADAGGTAQSGAATRFYRADDRAALESALNAIAIAVTGGDPEFATCDPGSDPAGSGGEPSGDPAGEDGDDVMFSQAGGCACQVQGRVGGDGVLLGLLLGLVALRMRWV